MSYYKERIVFLRNQIRTEEENLKNDNGYYFRLIREANSESDKQYYRQQRKQKALDYELKIASLKAELAQAKLRYTLEKK